MAVGERGAAAWRAPHLGGVPRMVVMLFSGGCVAAGGWSAPLPPSHSGEVSLQLVGLLGPKRAAPLHRLSRSVGPKRAAPLHRLSRSVGPERAAPLHRLPRTSSPVGVKHLGPKRATPLHRVAAGHSGLLGPCGLLPCTALCLVWGLAGCSPAPPLCASRLGPSRAAPLHRSAWPAAAGWCEDLRSQVAANATYSRSMRRERAF